MLRITQINTSAARPTIKLEGKLLRAWVGEVHAAVEGAMVAGQQPRLDLSALTYADSDGARLLDTLLQGGVELADCSPFVATLLHREATPMNSTTNLESRRTALTECGNEELLLAERLRSGDPTAFESLVRVHGGRLLAVAQRFLGCEAESADAVQDAFLSALQSLNSFRGDARLGTWLHRIVVNCCLMRLRTKKRRRVVSIDALLPQFDETGHHAKPVAAWQRQPHEACCDAELRRLVRSAIDQLPDLHREILLLRDIDGLDTAETASLLDVSESVVKTRLHRARQALRTLLEPVFANA